MKCLNFRQNGCNEVNSIAYEYPDGKLHVMTENVYVEIVDDEGDPVENGVEGNVYVTSLHNTLMPFVRYSTGDMGVLKYEEGIGLTLKLTVGRRINPVRLSDGREISAYVFLKAVFNVNALLENVVLQFRVVQNSSDSFKVFFVLEDDEESEQVEDLFVENIGQRGILNSIHMEFEIVEYIPTQDSGKSSWFVSNCEA